MKQRKATALYADFIKNSVFRVIINYSSPKGGKSSGSAFFIDRNHLLTCFHVVFGAELQNLRRNPKYLSLNAKNEHERLELFLKDKQPLIKVELKDGLQVEARLEKFDERYDIALLTIDIGDNKIEKCKLDFRVSLTYGDNIVFGGFPNQFSYPYDKTPFAYHEGMVSSFPVTIIGGDKYEHLQINSINLSGNSGAPLFLKGSKEVIGIINGNMNWGRDDLLIMKNSKIYPKETPIFETASNRIPLSIAYATTLKTIKEQTDIFQK